jgi:processive 1,2-diacylglycerol beta-glucosyltransferase
MAADAMQADCGAVCSVGSGLSHSVVQVLDTIRRVTGVDLVEATPVRRPGGPSRVVASAASPGHEVGRKPRHWPREMVRGDGHPPAIGAPAPSRRSQSSEREQRPAATSDEPPARIVVLSAGVGAGHDGVTRELARRLRERGFHVDCRDALKIFPGRSGRVICGTYRGILTSAPWIYDGLFAIAMSFRGAAPITRALLRPMRRRLLHALPPDTRAVVSTYPLASQILGPLRRNGQLSVPAITYLTDFGVHPIWIAPGVDAHCAVHEVTRAQAHALGGADVRVAGRLVSAGFEPGSPSAKRCARERFGLPPEGRLALLVAGSWGVGDVAAAAADVARAGVAVPVVVCAENEALYRRLQRQGVGHALGWVQDMPALMHAVDVLVENAGGLSALEGMACGLPVITYRPIAGHGRLNAGTMAAADVVSWVRRRDALGPALVDVLDGERGRRQREAGLALFESDPAAVIADVVKSAEQQPATDGVD